MMYDMVIIGAGPAGLSAAIYGQRAGKKTLLIDAKGFGGQIINTPEVENYPGIKKVSGLELATNLYEQATELGAEIVYEKAVGIEDTGASKKVKTESAVYETKSVIIATGAKNRPMGLENEEKYTGAGVSYCATCDGAFFRGRDVAVIGGGNTALEDAEVLSGIADKVYLIHRRDQFRGEEANVKRLREKDNVEFVLNSVPVELVGDTMISGLKVKNVKTEEVITLLVQGVFVAIGQMPDNKDFADVAGLDDKGYVAAGEDCLTNTPGVFTAGDCRTKKVRQLATAAADGAVAALAAVEYINNLA
ncbi:thioredoxin-disulfide reductase [Emergencia sp.]|uniref:thioredoxin-disulfide reductase n=1 Tax=Emergencia sp. TaxID=1926557 RepID=UPI003AF0F490